MLLTELLLEAAEEMAHELFWFWLRLTLSTEECEHKGISISDLISWTISWTDGESFLILGQIFLFSFWDWDFILFPDVYM